MRKYVSLSFVIAALMSFCSLSVSAQQKIKVACVGNSITEGYGLSKTYPMALQELMGEEYVVNNYGLGGRTLLKKGDHPYWNEEKYQEVLNWNPDIVIIKLGTNDSKPQNWQHEKDFKKDYTEFVKSFQNLPSKPKVYICYPIPVFEDKWGITESIVKEEIIPTLKKVAKKTKAQPIDLYTPFIGKADLTYDGVHPNDEGAALLANEVYQVLQVKSEMRAKK
ncbi:GDSL-type esterase/lipase family protein [Pontibacter sp. SGAir0037]|uniref:GDSL-type esterase/lipase family protein n=1 Tax=Pontibacter sp. SGAir0037 TaxID=2571030 RepID=UPI0010CCBD8A|nr:GDSL-type esterase/lipase family protein [Pontibacter sp. SGAir0037]QCR23728.1 sialate O-acetylesterase [Pontibacter sp. SGAir0037]